MTSATEYLYDHVTQKVLMEDMSFGARAPRPGERLPQFDLPSVDGGRVRSTDFVGRKPLLLITASYSCPMTASSNPILKDFFDEFGRRRLAPMAMGVGKMREMTRPSGPRAERDLWRVAPPMAAMAWLADLYRPLSPKWRTIAAAAILGAAVSAIVSAGRRRGR